MTTRLRLYLRGLILALPCLTTCGGGSPSGPSQNMRPANVSVSPTSWQPVSLGETQQFTASVTDAAGRTISGANVTWSSSHAEVATVSSTGLATAVADGTATIAAALSQIAGKADVTVLVPPMPDDPPDDPRMTLRTIRCLLLPRLMVSRFFSTRSRLHVLANRRRVFQLMLMVSSGETVVET